MQLERERLRVYNEALLVAEDRGCPGDAFEIAQIYRELADADAVLELLE